MKIVTTAVTLAALAAAAGAQCNATTQASKPACSDAVASAATLAAYHAESPNIVETAKAAGAFNTLLAAAQAAGLADALAGPGPFTVFAPTDDAFAKLPTGTVESLLKPENRDTLAAILKYHVVPGTLSATDVTRLSGAATLNGQRIDFAAKGSAVTIDKANVVKADIECSNGVIHVIDSVIMPEQRNLVEVAAGAKTFSTLLAAATAAGLAEPLMGPGPFTILAPTDEAFAKLPKGTVDSLLKPESRNKLAAILKYHVIPARVNAANAVNAASAETLNGQTVRFDISGGRLKVDGADITATDIDASNGVIHVIDTVLMPN